MTVKLPTAMAPVACNRDQERRIREYAIIIEKYFSAYGIPVIVSEINFESYGIQYCLEIALGTEIDRILRLQKELTKILAAPYNRLTIEAPIPGRNLIGIIIPWVCAYPDIPPLESPDIHSENIWLLKKSAQYYRLFEKICGSSLEKENKMKEDTHDRDSISSDYFFLKSIYSKLEQKPDIRFSARILEATFESFGLLVHITEIDISHPDHYLYYARPKIEMEAKNIVKLNKDIALALSAPGGNVGITAPMPGRDEIGIFVYRANSSGELISISQSQNQGNSRGYFRGIISTKLWKKSRDYFCRYDVKFKLADRTSLFVKYKNQFRKMNTNQLIEVLNQEKSTTDSLRARASRLSAMQHEFDRRNIDYSDIATFNNGLSINNKIMLVGKKITRD